MTIKRAFKDGISDWIFFCQKRSRSKFSLKNKCRILMYHSIERFDSRIDKMGLANPPDTFRMHMQYLKENDFHVIDLPDLAHRIIDDISIPDNSIVITFDDGYRSILTEALPILKEFGFTATLFINIHSVEKKIPKHLYWHDWQTLNWDEIKKLYQGGMLIGSHAFTHRRLTGLNEEELKYEIEDSKDSIERNINGKINTFSYPHGAFNKKVIKTLKENNFLCSCSSIGGTNDSQSNIYVLKRTEITSFDGTSLKFKKKISGSYDWLGNFHKWNASG
jgi:peptidoglycan/xylan/chitin deacetylase (PgdA/CDA1 family)